MRLTAAVSALAVASAIPFADISAFDTFVPKLISERKATAADLYGADVEVMIQYQDKPLHLQLSVNRDLFDKDWFLETTHEDGTITRTNDTAAFMCHYNGHVKGIEGSNVVMSLCDELGMRGTIHTDSFDIEVQHGFPLSEFNGARHSKRSFHGEPHIVYDLANVNVEGILAHAVDDDEEFETTVVGDSDQANFNAACVTASDSFRMNAYNSNNAEAQNTQSVMAQSNNRYRSTSWNNGHSLTMSIGGQVQNPSGWSHSSNMNTKLSALSTYKRNSHSGRDNVVGLTHFSYGGTIGLAWMNTMCQNANSCGLNNVGWSSSDGARGVLVAHEIGHNFNFDHDSNNNGGNGFVMWPSIITSSSRFSTFSRSRFESSRGRFGCL